MNQDAAVEICPKWWEGFGLAIHRRHEAGLPRLYRHIDQQGGMLKKAASGVLALLPCSRTACTLRASKGLRPCWTDFFEQPRGIWPPTRSRAF